jgi:flagellar biosynthesis protein FlhF
MQVKKFEAPTLQEALDTIKRELGPEAIILQTKQNRRGFGLMSKGSVEVTAAVSERATEKKTQVEKRIPEGYKQRLAQASATRQADVYESYLEKRIEKERVQLTAQGDQSAAKRITAVRYADIEDDVQSTRVVPVAEAVQEYVVPAEIGAAIDQYAQSKNDSFAGLQEEINQLKILVEELRKDRKRSEYLESDSPYSATDALESAYDLLLQSGVDRRFAVGIMRDTARNLGVERRADHEAVLDAVADRLLRQTRVEAFFDSENSAVGTRIDAFVGASGTGKTALIAKLGTHSSRGRQEKVGIIRVQVSQEEASDPLVIFAKALHVPYRAVSSQEELSVAIQDMSQCNRLFIDTPGVSPRDAGQIRKLASIFEGLRGVRINLVVSATTRDQESREQGKGFGTLRPASLMFTRLDECFSFGAIYSLSQQLGLPVSVFSNGKKVTEQWENASAERLTASILNIL